MFRGDLLAAQLMLRLIESAFALTADASKVAAQTQTQVPSQASLHRSNSPAGKKLSGASKQQAKDCSFQLRSHQECIGTQVVYINVQSIGRSRLKARGVPPRRRLNTRCLNGFNFKTCRLQVLALNENLRMFTNNFSPKEVQVCG